LITCEDSTLIGNQGKGIRSYLATRRRYSSISWSRNCVR